MRRPVFILLGLLVVAAAVFAGSFFVTRQICVMKMSNPADDLNWLRREYKLGDAEMARIRELHRGYLPQCTEMCGRIAAAKRELEAELAKTDLSPAAEQKLVELGALRARCQAQMLKHFVQVSQAMPAQQGQRYLAEMKRLTLGFHEQIEQSMSGPVSHEHHHE